MLKINVHHNNFSKEVNYIIKTIFADFLGLDYQVSYHDKKQYEIILPHGRQIIIQDHFFSTITGTYLLEDYLPRKVVPGLNVFTGGGNIIILYGTEEFQRNHESVTLGADIFASAFFMLTRWEEYVSKKSDYLGRFTAKESLAYKHNFLNRPIVDEYVFMLRNILKSYGFERFGKEPEFSIKLTHDIDRIRRFPNIYSGVRQSLAELIVNHNIKQSLYTTRSFLRSRMSNGSDPYDTFDSLMSKAENINTKAEFYFIPSILGEYDARYNIFGKDVEHAIRIIRSRNHVIGIHPSLNTYHNQTQFTTEKDRLEKVVKNHIYGGRHHYLRIEIPQTWQVWEENGLYYDTGLGYHDINGFRAGTCHAFSAFNILTQQELRLKIYPLIVMEATFHHLTPEDMEMETQCLLAQVKKHKGCFVWLWHNNNINTFEWEPYKPVYSKILSSIKQIRNK